MNQIVAMGLAGLAVGFMTGEMKIKDGASGALLGFAIGIGAGYLYTSVGDLFPTTALAAPTQQLALSAPASSYAL